MPEAACTSTQVHLQVSPDDFAGYWNAAQAMAGIQVAVGANSPYLFGRELVAESRIPLFEQSTDTRAEELKTQGVRPRVWFGERWITSIFDLFEENSRYFPALLPISTEEDPIAVLDDGGVPTLDELRLHNGTIYRWNRPVYDISGGTAAPAGGEPGAARRPDGGRHDGERRLLRRSGASPGRRGPADLDPDVVPGRERELHGGGQARHRRRGVLAAGRPGAGRRAGASAGCCRWPPTGSAAVGGRRGRERPAARHHRAALSACGQRCDVADCGGVAPRGGPGRPRPRPCAACSRPTWS